MIHRLPVASEGVLGVRLGEIPGASEVSVAQTVPLAPFPVGDPSDLLQEVERLEFVDVAVDRRLRRLQDGGELLDVPGAGRVLQETVPHEPVGEALRDRSFGPPAVLPFGKVADQAEEFAEHLLHVVDRGERGAVTQRKFERHADAVPKPHQEIKREVAGRAFEGEK